MNGLSATYKHTRRQSFKNKDKTPTTKTKRRIPVSESRNVTQSSEVLRTSNLINLKRRLFSFETNSKFAICWTVYVRISYCTSKIRLHFFPESPLRPTSQFSYHRPQVPTTCFRNSLAFRPRDGQRRCRWELHCVGIFPWQEFNYDRKVSFRRDSSSHFSWISRFDTASESPNNNNITSANSSPKNERVASGLLKLLHDDSILAGLEDIPPSTLQSHSFLTLLT